MSSPEELIIQIEYYEDGKGIVSIEDLMTLQKEINTLQKERDELEEKYLDGYYELREWS